MRHATAEPHVVELAAHRPQARFDVAQALAISQLSEGHRQKLVPTRKTLLLVIATVAGHALQELIAWKMIDDLGENSLAKIHPPLSAICAESRGDVRKPVPAKNSSNRKILNQDLTALPSIDYEK